MNHRSQKPLAGGVFLLGFSLTLAILLVAFQSVRAASTIYAAPAAQGSGSCSSWANACSLQTALAVAAGGDEIWVMAGVHYPGSVISDTFTLPSGVAVYGGFAGTETSREQRDWSANLTVLSGDIDQNDLTDPSGVVTNTAHITGTNSYHVVTSSGVTETAVLDGFVITAGWANGDGPHAATCDGPYCGGGMYNEGGGPTLANLNYIGNTSNWGGGGLFNNGSSPTLTNVNFNNNTSTSGGGMFNSFNTHPVLTDVTFTGNSAVDSGGGMYNQFANPVLTDVTFNNNSSPGSGGGMMNYDSSPTLTDVAFSSNSAANGGGMLNGPDSHPTLTNVTFSDNSASNRGGGIYNYGDPTLTNVIFSANSVISGAGGGMMNYGNPTLINVTFSDNTAPNGGGMATNNGDPTLTNVTFNGNSADNYGGGMYNYSSSSPILTDVTFSGNSAHGGGGMYNNSSSPMLTNVIFNENLAHFITGTGGGMYNDNNSNPTLTNVTFNSNQAGTDGGGMHNAINSRPTLTNVTLYGNSALYGGGMRNFESQPTLTNVILWGNSAPNGAGIWNVSSTPQISHSDIQGCGGSSSWNSACGADGGSNIDADPLFVDAANGDLHLQDDSPAINAGNNAALPPGVLTDLDGAPRIVRLVVDMGAYENQTFPCPAGGVLYVDQDAAGNQTGESWADALLTLQDALQVSQACELWVKAGVYYPDEGVSQADDDRAATFTLKGGVALYGGFGGTETARDQRDWMANLTVLSGDIDGNDLADLHGVVTDTTNIVGDNAYHVVTSNQVVDSTAGLDGFTITAGQANCDVGWSQWGGGMFIIGNSNPSLKNVTFSGNFASIGGGMFTHTSNPTLSNVTFSSNSADYDGGGMYNWYSSPTLTEVTFSDNTAANSGGGMHNWGSSPTLTNVTFSSNVAVWYGGGIYNGVNSSPMLTKVTFNGNSAGFGGGMYNWEGSNPTLTSITFNDNSAGDGGGMFNHVGSSPKLINVTFSGNSAGNDGGGMANHSGSNPSLTNVSFSDNAATNGGGMHNLWGSSPTLTNVILWSNTAPNGANLYNYDIDSTPQISTSDIQGCGGSGSWNSACGVDGGGNIEADPLFVDAANGDLRLQDSSPAINAGDNAALPPGLLTDLDGKPRFVRVFVDMGAYENQTFACPAGGVLYVDQNATGDQTGASWDDALLTLQDALQVTEACEIWLAEGVYYPDEGGSQAEDDPSVTFQLKNGVAIYGGFAGTETSREQSDWQANLTVLSGDLQQNDVDLNGDGLLAYTETVAVNARHVLYAENITSTIRIEGLTIRSGLNGSGDGAGMYLENSLLHMQDVAIESNHAVNGGGIASIYSSVTLENVTFAGNSAVLGNTGGGGGLYLYGAVPGYWQNLNNVTFVGNQAGYAGGGGLRVQYSPIDVTNSAFIGNTAISDYEVTDPIGGGGMYLSQSNQSYLADTLFRDNHAIGRLTGGEDIPERFIGNGGGLHVNESGYELVRVTFEENSAALGGGFYVYVHGEGHLSQVTFSHNHAYHLGGGAYSGAIEPYYHQALFTQNRAPYCGALCGWAMITDSVFTYNQAYDPNPGDENYHGVGGALNGYPNKIINSAFYSNTADASGPDLASWYAGGELINVTMAGGISCPVVGSSMTIMNSIIHTMEGDCTVTFHHSLYGALNVTSVTDEGGNLPDVDPLFVDLANGNLRLQPDSPAIDSGSTALATYGIGGAPILADLDGNPRLVDMPTVPDSGGGPAPIVDMGAYEVQYVDVALDKAVLPPAAAPGEAITFTLAVSNTGSLLATGIVVTDSLPAWLSGVSITSTLDITGAGALPPYVWQVQDLARGQGGVITVSGVLTLPLAAGTYTNTAFILATGDLLAENNTASISFIVPNLAPVFASIPLTAATEAAPYTYNITAQDDNGDALTITAPTLPAWLTLTDHGDGTATLAGTPETADVGQHAVALRVADGGGLTSTQSFTITIAYINDAPTFTSAPVLTATQDMLYSYAVAADDSDLIHGDALTITAPTLPDWLTLDWTPGAITATLSGTPTNAEVGNHAVVLRATDSAGLFAEQVFTITVANVNDAPEFTSAPVLAATQDVLYSYAVAAGDPDLIHSDTLTITAPTLPAWLTLTDHGDGTATLSGTPANAEVGEHPVVLRVTDRAGAFAEQSFTITVANVNDAPFFTSTPVLSTTQDAPYTYTIATGDLDLIHGDDLTITAPTLPAWLTLTDHGDGTAALAGTPTNANVGQHSVVLRVTDSAGLLATQTFTITVANVNEAPIFTSTPVLTATQDAPYSYTVTAVDLDLIHGDALTITALTLPAWLTLDWTPGAISATLSGAPTNADVGDHTVTLRVTDRAGLFAEQSFTVTVTNINDDPEFTSTPITTATQDTPYTYIIAVGDLDLIHGDMLTITATTLPGWLTLEQTGAITATLTGTPTNADVGDHSVVLRVTDSGGLSGAQAFIITVANDNEAPSFSSAPVLTATQDVLYSYAIAAGDPDLIHGDTLTISAPTLPSWLSLADHGDGTATLSGTPTDTEVGDHSVMLRVTDSSGLTDTQFFTITVTNVNDAPEFTSAPVLTGTQDVLYTFAVTADDSDLIHGDALTITAPTLPAWLNLVDHGDGTASLSGTPGDNDAGQNLVVLRVTDRAGAFAEQAFVIIVAERPRYYIYLPIVLRNWLP